MSRDTCQIYLVCGSGGVGKTTVSAAMAARFAKAGKKAIVITVDPAKRLATSLGIEALADEPKPIQMKTADGQPAQFWAMMLDTKNTFDRLIEKHAPDAAARDRIFGNKLYRKLSAMMAGVQEYMAMERLHELYAENTYDVIVVDTPPMQHALDFLAAPQRMMRMINNSMLQLFLKPAMAVGKKGMKFFEKGSRTILKVFDKITGFEFLQDLSEMVMAFQALLGGFEERARQVHELFANPACHFTAVCTTLENSVQETQKFSEQLKEYGYRLDVIVVNRVYSGSMPHEEHLQQDRSDLSRAVGAEGARILIDNFVKFSALIRRDKKKIQLLRTLVAKNSVMTVPLFESDVHELGGLLRVAAALE